LAHRIASRRYLPEGPRFASLNHYVAGEPGADGLDWAFGSLGLQDRAKHIATLYLNDLGDVIRDAVDPRFAFVRYAESLAASQPTFDHLHAALNAPLIAFLASEDASYVNGQVLGRTGFAYTLFQTPRQIATMWREGGWTPQEVADHFHEVLGQHLQPVGMGEHPLLGKKG